tara:strand:+ start:398 stop:736 length:339 start_codon:yes stop_codon:yes gene_type:complete
MLTAVLAHTYEYPFYPDSRPHSLFVFFHILGPPAVNARLHNHDEYCFILAYFITSGTHYSGTRVPQELGSYPIHFKLFFSWVEARSACIAHAILVLSQGTAMAALGLFCGER